MLRNRKLTSRALPFTAAVILIGSLISTGAFADGSDRVDPSLIGTWRWLGTITPVEKIQPIAGEDYLITFTEDGNISMKLETNRINGTYEVDGRNLKVVPPMVMTLAAWIPDSPAPSILKLMEHATGYFFMEGQLFIDTFADGGTMRFEVLK